MDKPDRGKIRLRLLLGDQLNPLHSWFREASEDVIYCMFELRQEVDFTPLHVQKVLAFFGAMRKFAAGLKAQGHRVIYWKLDDPENTGDLTVNIEKLLDGEEYDLFEYQEPDAWRLDDQLKKLAGRLEIPAHCASAEHFLCERMYVKEFFGKKNYLMERFYRHMRKELDLLMDGDEPEGGKWNYDKENRESLPEEGQDIPEPLLFDHDLQDIYDMLEECGVETFGSADPLNIIWPLDRGDALQLLEYFCKHLLDNFGTYQDAMATGEWSLYHSRLSFALNAKMIHPGEVTEAVIDHWRNSSVDIAQAEGFVRQIVGWREFMRGVYWAGMPEYETLNYFGHDRDIPSWYWDGSCRMNCLRQAIGQSLQRAYAHHIQRLMVTGNFALLAGIHPDQVDAWYLGIYVDAIHWVELPNTRGMSQYADGGRVASKPYVSSANYIDKMSNYCKSCHYHKSKKTGDRSCPFNSLYWHFLSRNREKLEDNFRMGMMYRVWDKMEQSRKEQILEQAETYLEKLEDL